MSKIKLQTKDKVTDTTKETIRETVSCSVVDSGNNRIQKFDSNGKFITKWGSYGVGDGKFRFADSIAVHSLGKNVYVTDSDNRSIKIFFLAHSTK